MQDVETCSIYLDRRPYITYSPKSRELNNKYLIYFSSTKPLCIIRLVFEFNHLLNNILSSLKNLLTCIWLILKILIKENNWVNKM